GSDADCRYERPPHQSGSPFHWLRGTENISDPLAQYVAQYFSCSALGQFGNEYDSSWVFVRRDSPLNEFLEVTLKLFISHNAFSQNDKCFRREQSVLFFEGDDSRFQYGCVLTEDGLHFDRRAPLPRYTENVVGASFVPVIPILIHAVFVSGHEPLAAHTVAREFRAVPVTQRG